MLAPFYLLIILLFSGCTIAKPLAKSEEERHIQKSSNSYFCSIPLARFSPSNLPCILVKTEGRTILVLLDSGFRGILSFSDNLLETIQEKTFLYKRTIWGFGGKKYTNNVYQIPYVKMGEIVFSEPSVEGESEEFRKNSCIRRPAKGYSFAEGGKVGWEMFTSVNLFLDLANEKIAICDSLETLEDEGYSVDSFVSVPLWTERGFVEFEVETSRGPLRCVLDSGCTWNVLRSDNLVYDPADRIDDPVLRIGGKDFQPQGFCSLPIQLPIAVEAILGMEFLEDHVVFIEFTAGKIHISKKQVRK